MCGISAWMGEGATLVTYELLLEIQHRGHDAAGIAFLKNGRFKLEGGPGFIWNAIDKSRLDKNVHLALGHVRYSTSGAYMEAYQPVTGRKGKIVVAFNGNIINFNEVAKEVIGISSYTWDAKALSDVLEELYLQHKNLADAVKDLSSLIEGSYSLVAVSIRGEILVARDPRGIRPLAYSLDDKHLAVASETAALSALGLRWSELERGRMVYCDREVESCYKDSLGKTLEARPCAFEYIYFLRPDSFFEGINAHEARKRMGERLAEKDFVDVDLVAPVPDSGRSAAIGYAIRRGLPFDEIVYRNRFLGRVFISAPSVRRRVLLRKFQVISDKVKDKRVVLVDDSIVRGDTSRLLVRLLKEAGVKEVHLRSAAPPIVSPCFFGIDMPTRRELIAYGRSVKEVRDYIEADTLIYNTVRDVEKAVGIPLCLGCFTSRYPIDVDIERLEITFSKGRR